MMKILPKDAYKLCCGRLHVSVTCLDSWGRLQNMIVNDFTSNEDLFQACLASSAIPYVTERFGSMIFLSIIT